MNGTYSASSVCTTSCVATPSPKCSANGTRNAATQNAVVLPKWWCQKPGAVTGMTAIDSRMPANGTTHSGDSAAPFTYGLLEMPTRPTREYFSGSSADTRHRTLHRVRDEASAPAPERIANARAEQHLVDVGTRAGL